MDRNLVLKDLCWRATQLESFERAIILAESFYSSLPAHVRDVVRFEDFKIEEISRLRYQRKLHRHVGIVTVIEKERRAVLTALGIPVETPPDSRSDGFSYWWASISKSDGLVISVVVTMVGEPRNVPCAIAVESLLRFYDVELLVMIGIAAGPRSKVKLGDVVLSDQVYDYEEVRLEINRFWQWRKLSQRPKYISPEKDMKVTIEQFDPKRARALFSSVLMNVGPELLPKGFDGGTLPNFHDGTIAAGEKLIADGSVERMRRIADERIRAADMEDSGFAQVAHYSKLPWCIFRGISDFGDPHKANGWQFVAALAAACFAISFLQITWSASRGYGRPK